MSDIGKNLKAVFETSPLKPADVSRNTGIPTSRISEIITGKTKNPGADTLFRILDDLGASFRYVVTGKGEMFESSAGQSGSIDTTLLQATIEKSEELFQASGRTYTSAQKAQFITTLYEMAMEQGESILDESNMKRMLRLVG